MSPARTAGVLALALCLGSTPVALAAQDESAPLPLPTEWDTHYAWFLVPNPGYAPGSEADETALQMAHMQYQLRLQERGIALTAGGFGQGEGTEAAGMTLLRAASLDEARRLAGDDPAVQAGNLLSRVREWWVPAGSLRPGPRSGAVTEAVLAFVEAHRVALAERDPGALRPMYATEERFSWYEDGELRYTSVDEILAGLASFPPEMSVTTTYDDLTVTPLGQGLAHVSAAFQTRAGEGARGFSFAGAMTMVVERYPGGWRIVSGHTSTGSPTPGR